MGYYHHFIQNYSSLAHPLNQHLQGAEAQKKNSPLQWNPASKSCFSQIEEEMLQSTSLGISQL